MRRTTLVILGALPAILLGLAAGGGVGVFYGPEIIKRMAAASQAGAKDQLYLCAMDHHIQDHPGPCDICGMQVEPLNVATSQSAPPPSTQERKILYWTDSMMNPPYIAQKPGKSPMGMDLEPVYADEVQAGLAVKIDPVVVHNMGVRLATAETGVLHESVRVVGTLTEPEQNHLSINLRVSGWIQKLYANQEGMHVEKGERLFDLYSPDLTAAADELIAARKTLDAADGADPVLRRSSEMVVATAKRKLGLMGLSDEQVEAIAKMDKAPATVTFSSPIHGHVAVKSVIEGSAVKAGDQLMEIADRSSMWLIAQVYEEQLPLVALGAAVEVTLPAVPGKVLVGKVDFIYPHLDMETRTAKVRVVLPNEDEHLHENMYATATIDTSGGTARVLVPREAVIDSGLRQIVLVAEGEGHFAPRAVTVGRSGYTAEGAEMVEVLTGLKAQEEVVTSGQFLLDSESRMQEAVQKMLAAKLAPAPGRALPAPPSPISPATAAGAATAQAAIPMLGENEALNQLVAAYLEVEAFFGAVQKDGTVADVMGLEAAAEGLGKDKDADLRVAGETILGLAKGLEGQAVGIQREKFKDLSDAVTALALHRKLARELGTLYVFDCQMTHHQWVQRGKTTANPFFPVDMKECGDLTATLGAATGAEGAAK